MTAAEVIARYEALGKQIAVLKDERNGLLRKVAFPWKPDRKGYFRMRLDAAIVCDVWPIDGRWSWSLDGNEWHVAEPNTPEGAKACADAQLLADGVLLA